MSRQPFEDPDLNAEDEQQLRTLLHGLPTLPMPPGVLARITAAITSEASTRDALVNNDVEPTLPSVPLEKRISIEAESLPSATDFEDLD